jgi:hypothetical protein
VVTVRRALLMLICTVLASAPNRATAVSVETAKKCKILTIKAFPPREIGNPAAGSAKGTGRVQQEYFNKCVANDGKVDDNNAK